MLPKCIASVILLLLLHTEAARFLRVLEVRAAACSLHFPPFPLGSCWGTWLVLLVFTPSATERLLWLWALQKMKLVEVLGCCERQ